MQFSIENIKRLAEKAYVAHVRSAFGSDGERALTSVLDSVRLLYQRCPPEGVQGTLVVMRDLSATPMDPSISQFGSVSSMDTIQEVGEFVAAAGSECVIVEVKSNGTFAAVTLTSDIDVAALAASAVVYRYQDGVESIHAKDVGDFVEKVSPLLKSNFASPTFHSLEEAFNYYRSFALESKCRILAKVWEGGVDGPRLVLVNRPESLMRDSLIQALQFILRDTAVRPEQNTDETKPVDIRVEWFGSGASALIEVKWLGKSTAVSRSKKPEGTYTEYGPRRAQEGADQLADYMDREVRHSGATVPKGYLVVFDARRRNIQGAADPLTAADATHYAGDVLSYDPDYSASRDDFAPPVRFFLGPRKSHFVAVA